MLAMVVNDDEGYLNARVVLEFFASMLAPTGSPRWANVIVPTLCVGTITQEQSRGLLITRLAWTRLVAGQRSRKGQRLFATGK